MATRREVEQRKAALRNMLREGCRDGSFTQGELMPPVRELAARHGLSVNVVREALQALVEEGVLYTVPRVGTFVGRPAAAEPEFYVLLLPEHALHGGYYGEIQSGFEERIAALGGVSLAILLEAALEGRDAGRLPPLAGLFDFAYRPHEARSWGRDDDLPRVAFTGWVEDAGHSDVVAFDNVTAGRQAAEHLLSLGHPRAGFLAAHGSRGYPGIFAGSAEREKGWREALEAAGLKPEGLAAHPLAQPSHLHAERVEAARATARALVTRPDVTAVVTADLLCARGLFLCLRDLEVPPERWPAVVSFGNEGTPAGHLVTTLRMPWDEIGRAAADLLWERSRGRLTGAPTERRVPMRLIPRLTTQPDWPLRAGSALLAVTEG